MNQRFIAPAFILSTLCALGLAVAYVTTGAAGNPQLEGALLLGAFGGMGVGMILWAKHLFPEEEIEQHRHVAESSPEEQEAFVNLLETGAEPVTRRKFLGRLAGTALAAIGLAALFPLKSLGPNPGRALLETDWRKGSRLTAEDGTPVKADTVDEGGALTVFPEGSEHKEDSAVLLVRVPPAQFVPRKGREDWAPQGNVAYSKVCTHVGCPVGLYRKATQELLCPCHQSTFNVLDGARPVFGPAARSLPQLPIYVDEEGYLRASSDFHEPVGPSFWDRNRHHLTGEV